MELLGTSACNWNQAYLYFNVNRRSSDLQLNPTCAQCKLETHLYAQKFMQGKWTI